MTEAKRVETAHDDCPYCLGTGRAWRDNRGNERWVACPHTDRPWRIQMRAPGSKVWATWETLYASEAAAKQGLRNLRKLGALSKNARTRIKRRRTNTLATRKPKRKTRR